MVMYIDKSGLNVGDVTFSEKVDNDIKLDEVRIQVADNWGNCIFTNRKGANLIYLALKNKKITVYKGATDSFDTLRAMEQLLKDNGIEYKVECK